MPGGKQRVAFVGLGRMGSAMACNICRGTSQSRSTIGRARRRIRLPRSVQWLRRRQLRRPATIVEDLTIPFARPRPMGIGESREFNEICGHLRERIEQSHYRPNGRRAETSLARPELVEDAHAVVVAFFKQTEPLAGLEADRAELSARDTRESVENGQCSRLQELPQQ